ncbi:MAG TPA: S-layer homology domain-containing protein, partial [Thermoanaerobaculia bacterium]
WASTGLGLGATRLVIDPADSSRIFAATYGSGVFVSTDAAGTWNPANAGIESGYIHDLALDPHDSQRLFAAASASAEGPGGIFVTTNAHDWSPVDLGETVNNATAVAIDPRDSSLVYAGGGTSTLLGGFFQSADGGAHWVKTNQGISGYFTQGVATDPAQAQSAFAISFGRVFHTDDSGASWVQRSDTGLGLTTLLGDPTDANTLYAGYVIPGIGGEDVLKSVDGGVTWNPAGQGLAIQTLTRLAISPSNPDHLLAAGYEGLFGIDSGLLWSPLLSGQISATAFDPADPSILYAGRLVTTPTGSGLLRSSDAGVTWNPAAGVPDGYFHPNDLVAPANDPLRVYVLSTTGVFRSLDRGLNFAPANTGLPPTPGIAPYRMATDPLQPGVLYMVAALGGAAVSDAPADMVFGNIFRSVNGADSWTQLPGSLSVFGTLDLSVSSSGRTLYASTISGIFQFERSFLDVPDDDTFWDSIDAAAMNGVTAGCGGGSFCPDDVETRAAMAVFLLRGKNGAAYAPPAATGTVFGDVPLGSPAASYIEELFHEGVTAGCGSGDYCPDAPLARAEAAVLLLKMEHGADYEPPPATGTVFADVPADAFAAAWIEQLALEGVTAGCGGGNFCPDATVSRAQAAAFVVHTFGLS